MLFGKKKKAAQSESEILIRSRHGRDIKYMVRRDKATCNETIIAREGAFNIVEDELVISCENEIVFRAPVKDIKAYELMNLSGINLVYDGESYVAYYTKGIENR